jgi:hypothetical protein
MLLKAVCDQSLGSTKHAIKSSICMKNSFSKAVAYFMEELAERGETTKQHRMVSAVGTNSGECGGGRRNNRGGRDYKGHGSGGGRNGGQSRGPTSSQPLDKWDPSKSGAYYSNKAFWNFTPDQHVKNKAAREASGITAYQKTTRTQLATLSILK